MRHYVIIGTGVAGFAAAEAIRGQDQSGNILLVGDEAEGFYSRPGLAYYLTGEITENQLFPFRKKDFQQLNVQRLHAHAIQIDTQNNQVKLESGQHLSYDRLLIATGARASQIEVPGNAAHGVVKLDNLQDARNILNLARKGRSAVVVGGGITALEIVEGLVSRGVKTHLFLRSDRYWRNVLDEDESIIVEGLLKEHGVLIHYNTELAEIFSYRNQVVGAGTTNGRQLKCELVALAVGVQPRKALAEAAGLKIHRGLLVDNYLQASDPDIFAAGDVAQVFDPHLGLSAMQSLWGIAREQGRVAGLNMAGRRQSYHRPIHFNVTRLANLTTTIIGTVGRGIDQDLPGIARGDSESWRYLPDAMSAEVGKNGSHLRLVVDQRTLIGAVVMGDQTLSAPLQFLITHQIDISQVRDHLIQPGAPIAALLADFWNQYLEKHVDPEQKS